MDLVSGTRTIPPVLDGEKAQLFYTRAEIERWRREHRSCGPAVARQTAPTEPLTGGLEAAVTVVGPHTTGHEFEATASPTHEAVLSSDLRAAATTFLPARATLDDPPAVDTDEASAPALEEHVDAPVKRGSEGPRREVGDDAPAQQDVATSTDVVDEPEAPAESPWAPRGQGDNDSISS